MGNYLVNAIVIICGGLFVYYYLLWLLLGEIGALRESMLQVTDKFCPKMFYSVHQATNG